jgi:hypothetical protein
VFKHALAPSLIAYTLWLAEAQVLLRKMPKASRKRLTRKGCNKVFFFDVDQCIRIMVNKVFFF